MNDGVDAVTLVEVRAAEEDEHGRAVRVHAADAAVVTVGDRWPKPRQGVRVDLGDGGAECIGGRTPA